MGQSTSRLAITADPSEKGMDPARLGRVSNHFDRYVHDGRLSGWLATVARGGELVWTGCGGDRDRESALPVTSDTIWRIYSMTKPLTSLAAMMLYEEGKFDLNDDVATWIDEFAEPRVYVGGPPSAPVTAPSREPVRVHHLLTQTSGMTYGFNYLHPVDALYRAKGYELGGPEDATLASAVRDWASIPLLFEPGSRWNYSVATDVVGRLIELWSGQTLDDFFRTRIFDPLGMKDTEWFCPPSKQERLAMLYVPGSGRAEPSPSLAARATRPPSYFSGGGGLVSTAGDYQRFTAMILRGGELDGVRLISRRTLSLMTENHLPNNADLTHFATGAFSETDFAGVGFGLGFSVVIDRTLNKSVVSNGTFAWGGAASTAFWIDPSEELIVSFFTQLLPSSTYRIRRELQRLVYQSLAD